jgi:hypothetical protein
LVREWENEEGWRYCRPFFRLAPWTGSRRTFLISSFFLSSPSPIRTEAMPRFVPDSPSHSSLLAPGFFTPNPDPAGMFTKKIRPEHLYLCFGRAYYLNFSMFLFFLNPIALV